MKNLRELIMKMEGVAEYDKPAKWEDYDPINGDFVPGFCTRCDQEIRKIEANPKGYDFEILENFKNVLSSWEVVDNGEKDAYKFLTRYINRVTEAQKFAPKSGKNQEAAKYLELGRKLLKTVKTKKSSDAIYKFFTSKNWKMFLSGIIELTKEQREQPEILEVVKVFEEFEKFENFEE